MWVKAVTTAPFDADGSAVSTNVWSRTAAAAVRERFGRTALAQYGAGLHTDCDDCAVEPDEVLVPSQRRSTPEQGSPTRAVESSSSR